MQNHNSDVEYPKYLFHDCPLLDNLPQSTDKMLIQFNATAATYGVRTHIDLCRHVHSPGDEVGQDATEDAEDAFNVDDVLGLVHQSLGMTLLAQFTEREKYCQKC